MKYLIELILVLLLIPVMTIWAVLASICLMLSAIQIPIHFIVEHVLDLAVNIEYKLEENN